MANRAEETNFCLSFKIWMQTGPRIYMWFFFWCWQTVWVCQGTFVIKFNPVLGHVLLIYKEYSVPCGWSWDGSRRFTQCPVFIYFLMLAVHVSFDEWKFLLMTKGCIFAHYPSGYYVSFLFGCAYSVLSLNRWLQPLPLKMLEERWRY